MRRADAAKTKITASTTADVRVQIQEEIEVTKKQRRRAVREKEKARQLDRQREEIHPCLRVFFSQINLGRAVVIYNYRIRKSLSLSNNSQALIILCPSTGVV